MDDVRPTIDPDGSADYGNIDSLMHDDAGTFLVAGEFGDVRVVADRAGLAVTDAT